MEEAIYDALVTNTPSGAHHVDEQSQDHWKGKFSVTGKILVLNGRGNFRFVTGEKLFEEIKNLDIR